MHQGRTRSFINVGIGGKLARSKVGLGGLDGLLVAGSTFAFKQFLEEDVLSHLLDRQSLDPHLCPCCRPPDGGWHQLFLDLGTVVEFLMRERERKGRR